MIRIIAALACAVLIPTFDPIAQAQPTDGAMTNKPASERDMYLRLRELALTVRTEFDAASNYGVLLEMPIDDEVATFALYGDGTVSLYYSNGGGVIGVGQANPDIAQSARDLIAILASQEDYIRKSKSFAAVTSYPLPQKSQACIYFKTPSGVLLAQPRIASLESGKHELSALWDDLQALLGRVFQASQDKAP